MYITLPMERVTGVRLEGGTEAEWLHKEVEGAPVRGQKEREEKKLYSPSDMEKLHKADEGQEWPEQDGSKGPEGEED